jgi:signal transduction histidine kinase
MHGLLPVAVDAHGLMSALQDLAERIHKQGTVACTFVCAEAIPVADNLVATHLFLIAQEAVHNAVKHAQAKNIVISLAANHFLVLRVKDDGIGIADNQPKQGLGMRIMRNRSTIISAELTVEPAQPTGTLVTCKLARRNDHRKQNDEAGPRPDHR